MTLAVVVTMWVSLSLFGLGLLASQQVELIKGKWYDKIEITVFLCIPVSQASTCDSGVGTTDSQRTQIQQALTNNPEVSTVYYESKAEAFADFKQVYAGSPILSAMTQDMMQDSFRVKLKDPQQYQGVVAAMSGMKGVESVQDLHTVLDPLFAWLNMAQWGTIGASVLLLIAAALQIGNTIRLSAFSRRREIGIMRLVGASNWYIMLPFLLESLVAAIIGAVLAGLSMTALVGLVIQGKAAVQITSVAWVSWSQLQWTIGCLAVVAIVLSIIPTLIATRRFLRV